jgi:hypothetical protein
MCVNESDALSDLSVLSFSKALFELQKTDPGLPWRWKHPYETEQAIV